MAGYPKAGYPKQGRFLTRRGDRWYYQRPRVRYPLRTSSLEIAWLRRDALGEADLNFWTALAVEAAENNNVSDAWLKAEEHRYKAAQTRALVYGFAYKRSSALARGLATVENVDRLLERVELIEKVTTQVASQHPPIQRRFLAALNSPSVQV